jgi:hypothetical protein
MPHQPVREGQDLMKLLEGSDGADPTAPSGLASG